MSANCNGIIAERELIFSYKGENVRHKLTVQVHLPVKVNPTEAGFDVGPGTASCRVEFNGLDEPPYIAHGADGLQALEFAVNIDPILRSMQKKYSFYFTSGEDYFDESREGP